MTTVDNNHLTNKELKLLANKAQFLGQCIHLFDPIKTSPLLRKNICLVYICTLFIYTHTFIKVSEAWSPQTGVFSKKEGHRRLRWLNLHQGLPMPLSNCSYLLHSAKTALCRGWKTYLEVVRWQRNDETFGTATAAQQRVLGHPPPATTALRASLWSNTHLKMNQDTQKPSERTGHRSRTKRHSVKHTAIPSLSACKYQNNLSHLPIFQVFQVSDNVANNKCWTEPDAQHWIPQNLPGRWLPGKSLLCLRERIPQSQNTPAIKATGYININYFNQEVPAQ